MRNTSISGASRFLTRQIGTLPSLTLCAAFGVIAGLGSAVHPTPARAQNGTAAAGLRVRIERGQSATLPIPNVARVLPENIDVARASFNDNRAVLEGVSLGTTSLEVVGIDGRSQTVVVEVVAPGTLGNIAANTPQIAPANDQVPATDTPIAATVQADTGTDITGALDVPDAAPITPSTGTANVANSPHNLSLRVGPVEDNSQQALVTVSYTNQGESTEDVTVRYALDELVSYVTNSATGEPKYDAAARELSWNVNGVTPGTTRTLNFRVEPSSQRSEAFYSIATVESKNGGASAGSNNVRYSFVTTPLLTVFALPDRIIAGRNAPVLVDVRGLEFQAAIDRLQKVGVVQGKQSGLYYPTVPTQRAEYVVMTLKGLNLRDLRDVTAIKFVLGRPSTVNLTIYNADKQVVTKLVDNKRFEAGEGTALWDGSMGSGYAPTGRYSYVCVAKDGRGETTTLTGTIQIVSQTPLEPAGMPSFTDVKTSDWFAGYLAIAEKQDLAKGYPNGMFRPEKPISRVEATAVVVRALGLEDLAKSAMSQDVGFLDYQDIPNWATGYVNVASTVAKSAGGRLIVGYPSNFFLPNKSLRRDEAALIVQRLIDKDANRRVPVSGAMVPGAVVTINNRTVEAGDNGQFQFVIEQGSEPTSISVVDRRN